ncbi:hypothetical protein FDA52_04820 [Clostridium botulinum]|nr:hypothetical protein [Clostridium botulinum]NFI52293.1 hypothetical protein [Clostridium botulinum]
MKIINKFFCFLIIISTSISMISCTKSHEMIFNTEWYKKTDKLVELGKQENNLYNDYLYRYTDEANIYETMYLLELSNIIGHKNDYITETKQYILTPNAEVDENNLQDLICLYKVNKYIGISNSDIKNRIEKIISENKIIDNLNQESNLTEDVESLIFILADIKDIIPNLDFKNLESTFEQFKSEILKNNEKLYILNPIDKLINNKSDWNNYDLKNKIISRVNILIDHGYDYIWEIYNLIEFSIKNDICNKDDFDVLIKNSTVNLFQGKNKLSNMKMLYLIKSYEILEPSLIQNLKDVIITNIKACELVTGGYIPQTTFTFPDDFTYLAMFLKKNLNSNIKDDTKQILYSDITNDIISKQPNWKYIYRFLTLTDKDDLRNNLIEIINKYECTKLFNELSEENELFYYLSMIELNYDIDNSKLDSFI